MNHKRILIAQALSSTLLGKYLLELAYRYFLLQHYVIFNFQFQIHLSLAILQVIIYIVVHALFYPTVWVDQRGLLGVIENKGVIKNNTQWFSYQTISIH